MDVFHLVCLCTAPELMHWRAQVTPASRRLIADISSRLRIAHDEMGRDVGDLCDEVASEAMVVVFGDTDDGRFILRVFRLLLCHP